MSQTLAQMRTRVRQHADMVGSNFCSDSEIDGYLNNWIADLWDLLVAESGEQYGVDTTPTAISFTANVQTVSLPSTFLKLKGVDVLLGGCYRPVGRFEFGDRHAPANLLPLELAVYQQTQLAYCILGNKLFLQQAPTTTYTGQIWIVPAVTTLVADGDTFDGINRWEEYAVLGAALDCLDKEESDTRSIERKLARETKRIERACRRRDAGAPAKVRDVRNVTMRSRGRSI